MLWGNHWGISDLQSTFSPLSVARATEGPRRMAVCLRLIQPDGEAWGFAVLYVFWMPLPRFFYIEQVFDEICHVDPRFLMISFTNQNNNQNAPEICIVTGWFGCGWSGEQSLPRAALATGGWPRGKRVYKQKAQARTASIGHTVYKYKYERCCGGGGSYSSCYQLVLEEWWKWQSWS